MEIRTREENRPYISKELVIDNQIVSQLFVINYKMRIGSSLVRMGEIGGVQTEPAHRKKGYARMVMIY